jgi:hypothetical protein
MKNLHLSQALLPEDGAFARQIVEDLSACISGAEASGHSKETLPAYIGVRKTLVNLLQALDAQTKSS